MLEDATRGRGRAPRHPFRLWPAACALALLLATPDPFGSRSAAAEPSPELRDLRLEIARLREEYAQRLADLEARLAALETRAAPGAEDELSALRAEARRAAGAEAPAAGAVAPTSVAPAPVGHERNLNRLNPEISFTGDVVALHRGSREDIDAREFELDLQAALDPFSYSKWTLAHAEEGVEIEEGYIGYNGIGAGLSFRAGRMRQTFGALNRYHLHALPQPDYPLVYLSYLGEDGLVQTGFSLDWLLPRPWASANEVTLQLTDGSSEPFGGESFDRLATLLHVKSYWDASAATYVEWGLSGVAGSPDAERDTRVYGTDLTVHWQPPARAKYREITWRTEMLLSRRDDPLGVTRKARGGYSYLEGLLRRNLYAGLRYDRYEDPLDPDQEFRAVEPYLTWWQSEFVRLRLAYQALTDELLDETDNRFRLQITWSAGPHKHESY